MFQLVAVPSTWDNGLQVAYQDQTDRSVEVFVHMILALAFVPVADVRSTFLKLRQECSPNLLPLMDYFDKTYVRGRPARGRRHGVPPRYSPEVWNQYAAACNKSHRTNNASEGWRNRFRLVVGKHHPDLYFALMEFKKEQADTEIAISELLLGRRVKIAPKRK